MSAVKPKPPPGHHQLQVQHPNAGPTALQNGEEEEEGTASSCCAFLLKVVSVILLCMTFPVSWIWVVKQIQVNFLKLSCLLNYPFLVGKKSRWTFPDIWAICTQSFLQVQSTYVRVIIL